MCFLFFFFFKQKTAYEMRISDWSSDVCSSDLVGARQHRCQREARIAERFDILERMNRDVDDARVERRLVLARPQRLADDRGKCAVLNPVAGRGHRYDAKRSRAEPTRRAQRRPGPTSLRPDEPRREDAAA